MNGILDQEIYLEQPEGYINDKEPHLVYKLHKAVYGLKQSAKAWNDTMNQILNKSGFIQSNNDQCLYTKTQQESMLYLLIYVDDICICHENQKVIMSIAEELNENFETVDLGNISSFLGIRVQQAEDGSFLLDQELKINNLLQEFGLENASQASTPMDTEFLKSVEPQNLLPNNEKFRKAVGALLHLSTTTRPDIALAIGHLCRRVSQPSQRDWDAVKRVIKYLKGTSNYKLKFSSQTDLNLVGFVDADWAGDVSDRKSTSGFIFMLGANPILWASKKQSPVALSSTEAEYISAAHASQEVVWLRRLIVDFGIPCEDTTVINEDNQGCIKLATNQKASCRTKHIDVRYHHLRDLIDKEIIRFVYCETAHMLADGFTKPLPKEKFLHLRKMIGIVEE